MSKIDKNWCELKGDYIEVPNELMPLFNKVATQIRFHTISGKGEAATIAHILEISRQFFSKNSDLLV